MLPGKTINNVLWESANVLRSTMNANDYKDYLLGLIFYKYLSDNMLEDVSKLIDEPTTDLEKAQQIYEEAYHDPEIAEDLKAELMDRFGYVIEPELTYTALMQEVHQNTFQRESLEQAFRNVEQSNEIFAGLFDDIDLYSNRLGSSPHAQSSKIQDVMKQLDQVNMAEHQGDVLGDAYEYLIGMFAKESGSKAGEFYTPQPVSELMTRIVTHGKEDKSGFTVFDPTMGSGALMLRVKDHNNYPHQIGYFGQEINTSTYNLARMNMILHDVPVPNQHLKNGDTLDADWPVDEPTNFDAVMMNPPYSARWTANPAFLDDPRFSPYGKLAPKSRADMAFLLHGFFHLKEDGAMAIVLPHGVLFRGGAEATIRQKLLEDGSIDAVIGLPADLFYNTSIPTTIIILKKNNPNRDVMFIDASSEFERKKTQNHLTEEHIQKIVETYLNREGVEKYAHLASFEEIKENDFNLNIPRYVDTFEEEEPIDIVALSEEMVELNKQIEQAEADFLAMVDQLEVTEDSKEIIEATKRMFGRDL